METATEVRSGFKKNIGKTIVLALYVFIVFISPLYYLTPWGQESFSQLTTQVVKALVPDEDKGFFANYISSLQQDSTSEVSKTQGEAELVGGASSFNTSDGKTMKHFDLLYELSHNDPVNKYLILRIAAEDTGNGIQVLGTQTSPQPTAVKDRPFFSLDMMGWLFLVLALLIPLFIVFTAYRYITKESHPKWIFFIVILILSANLTIEGQKWGVNFGFTGFMTPALGGTWFFALPVPLGALYYWGSRLLKKKKA
jgi:hypothetical protein